MHKKEKHRTLQYLLLICYFVFQSTITTFQPTMIIQVICILGVLLLGADPTNSFSISSPHSLVSSRSLLNKSTSTCLRAEDEKETETASDETEAPASASTDILNSPAFLKRKIDVLKSDIAQIETDTEEAKKRVEEGRAEWGPQLEELQREYKTIQERMSNQNQQGDSMATVNVVREMLDLLDNFDRAFGVVTAETDSQKEIEAEYKQVYASILETFEKLGVTEVETLGKEFDFQFHQAVMQRPSEDYEEGIVCDEFQKGFVLGDTLIRAAMVAVAA